MVSEEQLILTLACPDAKGIVHAVSGLLYQAGCNIIDSQQFGDLQGDDATGQFFMRVHVQAPPQLASAATLAANDGIPFVHLPLKGGSSPEVQILSKDSCHALAGRAINIHHSFLPGFKGARPYFQAHARGVKLIGATAHHVTADLDEGPIIEQDVQRVERPVLVNGHKCVAFR